MNKSNLMTFKTTNRSYQKINTNSIFSQCVTIFTIMQFNHSKVWQIVFIVVVLHHSSELLIHENNGTVAMQSALLVI